MRKLGKGLANPTFEKEDVEPSPLNHHRHCRESNIHISSLRVANRGNSRNKEEKRDQRTALWRDREELRIWGEFYR
ncbi:hypothetical protein TB1_046217 [Malus domestica]